MQKGAFKGITILFTILFACSFIIIPADGALTWTVEKVISDIGIREGCSLVLDSTGKPWISYNVNDELRAAHYTGTAWETESVDITGDGVSAIAINGEGNPVIVYQDSSNSRIEYAKRVGTTWHISTVDGDCPLTSGISLVLNSAGHLHVAYTDYLAGILKYASSQDGSDWSVDPITVDCSLGDWPSIQINSAGNPCICYYDTTRSALLYIQKVGGSWSSEIVDSCSGYKANDHHPSLKLRSDGQPGVSYVLMDMSEMCSLHYSYRDGEGWHSQLIDSEGKVGTFSSLSFDHSNYPHISYYDNDNGDLKYAYYDGASWQVTVIDSAGDVGRPSSLAMDDFGNPYICYIDHTIKALKYAYPALAAKLLLVTPESDGVCVLLFSVLAAVGCYIAVKRKTK